MSSPSFKVLQQRPQGVVAVLEVDFLVLGSILNPSLRAHVNPSIKDLSRKKMDPPEIVPPGPTTSKYLDPPVQILQVSTEVFGPPLK